MLTLQKRLYAWELNQAYVLKKFMFHTLSITALLVYWLLKFTVFLVFVMVERPKLRKQIAPGEYQEVENLNIGPRIQF